MLIRPFDAIRDDSEWQDWLAAHDFGQLVVNGRPGEAPYAQPTHFLYDASRGEVVTHLARPNPLWPALEANPDVLLSVVDDHVFVPGPWQAAADIPPEHGEPTSFYAAVQLRCTAHVMDDPAEKAELLNRQVGHFQPEGGTARVAAGEEPFSRKLAALRGLRLEVTEVRAKFKYAGKRSGQVRERIADELARRDGPRDDVARAHLLRRHGAGGAAGPA
ncbi:FMN-binding negative transcriptional regulator [Streptomyces sp. NPDC048664]|uniref:FMN-binding negative transcriptional regulator n=1 Tax=Streptomyces sp. NPDC048664 TaxID=3154505 RepID=UPI00344934AC